MKNDGLRGNIPTCLCAKRHRFGLRNLKPFPYINVCHNKHSFLVTLLCTSWFQISITFANSRLIEEEFSAWLSQRSIWNPRIRDESNELTGSSKGLSWGYIAERSKTKCRMLDKIKPTYSVESGVDGLWDLNSLMLHWLGKVLLKGWQWRNAQATRRGALCPKR